MLGCINGASSWALMCHAGRCVHVCCLAVVLPGFFLKAPGQVAPCPQGEFKSGTAACTKCPLPGTTTSQPASTHRDNCTGGYMGSTVRVEALSKLACLRSNLDCQFRSPRMTLQHRVWLSDTLRVHVLQLTACLTHSLTPDPCTLCRAAPGLLCSWHGVGCHHSSSSSLPTVLLVPRQPPSQQVRPSQPIATQHSRQHSQALPRWYTGKGAPWPGRRNSCRAVL